MTVKVIEYRVKDYGYIQADAKAAFNKACAMYRRNGYIVATMWSGMKQCYTLMARPNPMRAMLK